MPPQRYYAGSRKFERSRCCPGGLKGGPMSEEKALSFLQLIRRSQRGKLKVYLGYGPGVGKTWQMLVEGQRLKNEGIDVVVGLVETHGRAETAKLVEGSGGRPKKEGPVSRHSP